MIFRKISDVKREEEEMLRRKNEAPLIIPPDHPVRRLFQRFRQQREERLAAERAGQGAGEDAHGGPEKASVRVEQPRVQGALASTCIVMVTDSPAPTAVCSASTVSRAILHQNHLVGCKSAEPHKAKGWGRFKETVVKGESWSSVSKAESLDTLPDRTKSHDEMSLKKTDSCDSGITKSDLRLDNVCDAGTPQDPSPVQPNIKQSSGSSPDQGMQALLLEFKKELREGIGALDVRMSALEGQLAEMLELLRSGNTLGSPSQSSHPPSPVSENNNISEAEVQ